MGMGEGSASVHSFANLAQHLILGFGLLESSHVADAIGEGLAVREAGETVLDT
jgi:hypothetical protein